VDATARREREAQNDILAGKHWHRMKNLLALGQMTRAKPPSRVARPRNTATLSLGVNALA
jgi:hypothetical protein